MDKETFDLVVIINAAVRILSFRVLTLLCLLMTFGLFCWAMFVQTVVACGISGGFAILVFLPVLFGERRKEA